MKKQFLGIGILGCVLLFTPFANAAPEKTPTQTAASKKPEPPVEVLQQVQSGPLTIRLRRARWADSEEVLIWRNRGKQLTLWFDALSDPSIKVPEGLTLADFIVNVRLLDERGKSVQVFPVDLVRSLHRPSLPYVPAKSDWNANGQSVWRAQPFDPNFDAVKLQIEWLRPGYPFDRKTIPPSLLETKDEAVSTVAREWLQVLEMPLPASQIEHGATHKFTPIAQVQSEHFDATLFRWRQGTSRIISGEGAGTSHAYVEAGLILSAKDARDQTLRRPLRIVLRNEAGETFAMTQRIQDPASWFTPSGKPVNANERVVTGSFTMPSAPDEKSRWHLKVHVGDSAEGDDANGENSTPILEMRDLPTPPGATGNAK